MRRALVRVPRAHPNASRDVPARGRRHPDDPDFSFRR
jgi:hypothetical protein